MKNPFKKYKKQALLIIIHLSFFLSSCKQTGNDDLQNSVWKFCGDTTPISDILVFDKEHLYVKNDRIYWHKNDSLIGLVDTIIYHYGEERLYIKNLNDNKISRYCKQ